MKFTRGMWLVALLATVLLGAAGGYAQTQPTSITISPQSPTLFAGQTLQFTAQSGTPLNLGESRAIAAGYEHTCAVLASGTVKCWGRNGNGQLGDGTKTTDDPRPVTVSGLTSRAVAIAAGQYHTCALLAGGTVMCWGANGWGQLGNGNHTDSPSPVAVSGLSGAAVAIAAGGDHTCALLSSGTVMCWGRNDFGQLGDGTKTETAKPVAVLADPSSGTALGDVTAIAAGDGHTCVVLSNGTANCWGSNSNGQLGDGTKRDSTSPVTVTGLTNAVAISTRKNHTCAVLAGGTAMCWGLGSMGQLGDGSKTDRTTPVQVLSDPSNGTALGGVTAIAAGDDHTCALLADGTANCWGYGPALGDGSTTESLTPVAVSGLSGGVAITAGLSHTCALRSDGTLHCWGNNVFGDLGDGTRTLRLAPVTVTGGNALAGRGAIDVTAGDYHTCALLADGEARCWGDGKVGQLGVGYDTISTTPAPVSGLSGAVAIAAGDYHTCAVLADGTVKCWGHNNYGQLGDGSNTDSPSPVAVNGLTGPVVSIAAGRYYTCAVLANGTAWCWGSGYLGNGSNTDSPTPVQVSGLNSAVAIAAGASTTCALKADGTVWCWGSGYLGNGTYLSGTPVQVSGLNSAVAIAAGASHTCAQMANGKVKCWGDNYYGQLGNGSQTASSTPVSVSGLSSAVAIAAGLGHTCAVLANGTAKCWGWNDYGQLGDGGGTGADVFLLTPVSVQNLTGAVAITAREEHTCALLADGTAKCWGHNNYGQLGDDTILSRGAPVLTAALVPSLVWTSSNHYVATIGKASGLATGVGTGNTIITATYGALSANTVLHVY